VRNDSLRLCCHVTYLVHLPRGCIPMASDGQMLFTVALFAQVLIAGIGLLIAVTLDDLR
jgi:hypothetical protein